MPSIKHRATGLALKAALSWRARPGLVSGSLKRRQYTPPPPPDGQSLRVGVVQMAISLVESPAAYADRIFDLTRQAVEQGAQLVVFPEDTGIPLVGLLPSAAKIASTDNVNDALRTAVGEGATLGDVFKAVAPAAQAVYEETFSTLAHNFAVPIVTGSIYLPGSKGDLYNVAYLYGPNGALLERQIKTQLFHFEDELGIVAGERIRVATVAGTRLAFPVCMDHSFFEPDRIAWLQGAEIIIDPSADFTEEYSFWEQMRGVWGRVQENPAYGVLASMVGDLLGFHFRGRSGVYAPLALSPAADGVLAEADNENREQVLVTPLDLAALRAYKAENSPEFNLPLYQKYLPELYKTAKAREVVGRRLVLPPAGPAPEEDEPEPIIVGSDTEQES